MGYIRFTCADTAHCGRSFLALEGVNRADRGGPRLTCPYCGETATPG